MRSTFPLLESLPYAGKVVFRNALTYSKLWKSSLIGNSAEPLFYLLAVGVGLGPYVQKMAGVPYVLFLAPALVASSSMFTACFEAGFSAFARLTDQHTFHAQTYTPLLPRDIAFGEVLWASLKACLIGLLVFCIVALAKLAPWNAYFLLLPVFFLNAFLFAALSLWVTTKVRAWEQFSYFFGLLLQPLFFFSGTFFPIDSFPAFFKVAVLFDPLYHTVEIVRPVFLGQAPSFILERMLFLVAFALFFLYAASTSLERRLMED